jgi:ADP-heptose:LPS heptosyltransferase
LDDICILAAAPIQRLGNSNTNVHADWNRLSDDLYTELFQPPSPLMHEFHFNAAFAEWACGLHYPGTRPKIDFNPAQTLRPRYILCFVGASIRSKRWPASRWIEFINEYRAIGEYHMVIAGNGPAEIETARIIEQAVPVESLVGKATLTQLLSWVANAAAVISNDTMAAHLGAGFDVPTVIIANGVNYMRFADYSGAGITNVRTLYPRAVMEKRKRYGNTSYAYSETVTADIVSIEASQVLAELCSMLPSATQHS